MRTGKEVYDVLHKMYLKEYIKESSKEDADINRLSELYHAKMGAVTMALSTADLIDFEEFQRQMDDCVAERLCVMVEYEKKKRGW